MWIINGPVCYQNASLAIFSRWLRSLMGFYLRMSTQVRVSFYLCPNLLKIWLKFIIILTLVSVKILTRALQLQFIWDTEINALKFKFTSSWAYQQQMPTTFQVCSGICYVHTSTRTLLLSWKVIIINHLVNRVTIHAWGNKSVSSAIFDQLSTSSIKPLSVVPFFTADLGSRACLLSLNYC